MVLFGTDLASVLYQSVCGMPRSPIVMLRNEYTVCTSDGHLLGVSFAAEAVCCEALESNVAEVNVARTLHSAYS